MSDPKRWIDGGEGEELRALLEASRQAGPTLAQKSAVGAKVATGGASTAAWGVKGAIASALLAGGVTATALATNGQTDAEPSSPEEPQPVELTLETPILETPDTQEPAAAPPEVHTPPAAPKTARQEKPKPAPPARPSEGRLLTLAKNSLSSSPQQAIRYLDQHQKLYPTGVLAQERDLLRLRALAASGKKKAAESKRRAFEKDHPDSIHDL